MLRVARDVAAVLRCDEPYALYQLADARQLNAQLLLGGRPFGVRLLGPVVNFVDDAALRAMPGHEFGHYPALRAHRPRWRPTRPT